MNYVYLISKTKITNDETLIRTLKATFNGRYVFYAGNYISDEYIYPDIQIYTQNRESVIWLNLLDTNTKFIYDDDSLYYILSLSSSDSVFLLNYCIELLQQGDFYIRNAEFKKFSLNDLEKKNKDENWEYEKPPKGTRYNDIL